jgi:hypothetical protein
MIRCFAALLAIGLTTTAWAAEPPDDQQLIQHAPRPQAPPATVQTPPAAAPSPRAPEDLEQAEQAARVDANLALARLEMVLGRKALRAGDLAESAVHAEKVLGLLRDIPPDVDVSEIQLQAEGILARAARAGVKAGAAPPPAAAPPSPDFARQGRLRDRYEADAARALTEADEGRLIPRGVVSYPPDWRERMAKRKKWADGVIARSPSTYDKDGREWYAAIYDIHDLTYVPPDFANERIMAHSSVLLRDALDRQALRDGSMIFRGTAADLAAGIPLLRYFGGVDPWLARGPKYSPQRQQAVIDLIRALTGVQVNEAPPP